MNLEVLYHLTAMQRYLQTPGNSESLQDAAKCVRAQFKVPIIQGCLKYAFQASSAEMTKDDDLSKIKAEAWAFCVGALAFLNDVDSVAAQNAEAEVTLNTNARPNWDVVKKAFSTSNLNRCRSDRRRWYRECALQRPQVSALRERRRAIVVVQGR